MTNDIEIIQQVLNQAVKAGIFNNLESVAVVWRSWGTIKYQLEENGKKSSDHI